MQGFLLLLICYLLGNVLSKLVGGIIPGSVIGMALLFAALLVKAIKPKNVEKVCRLLTDNMMLFFVPVSVGLMTSYKLLGEFAWAIIVSAVASTILVLACVGITQQWIEKIKNKR